MSSIVKFFVATREDAIDTLNTGPIASTRIISFGNFDAEEALLDWEAHLTGKTFSELLDNDVPEEVAESDDGPVVLLLSDALLNSLSSASSSQLDELAMWWASKKAVEGIEIDPPLAANILQELVELIHQQREPDESVYCWTG
ncbi:hypothetical protein JIX56_36135 [Streptomyces sp. CA-210063]|uniref:hypothetical protein n=1 Tax=Streptomyces sp. CA-210063 TaxID=2801029 RepID=UPI00214B4B60|nr:hypothetical protein [Streptomyces sp. CA-210063]UUU34851.1 hypothetical protein JIX56_36135 [Streptomyces sp. CA-210063]